MRFFQFQHTLRHRLNDIGMPVPDLDEGLAEPVKVLMLLINTLDAFDYSIHVIDTVHSIASPKTMLNTYSLV